MKQVFEVGDIVYHPVYGQGSITAEDGPSYSVNYLDGRTSWCLYEYLSYKPWSKPVHIRPLKQGWYVFKTPKGQIGIGWFKEPPSTSHNMLVYLGENLPEKLK